MSNSQSNIRYELTDNGGVIWDTKIGTSGAFNFNRPVNVAGTYRIKAINTSSGMIAWMNRACVITKAYYPIYSISSSDQHFCLGDHNIGISGSETDVKYWLMLNGNQPDTISLSGIHGTGLPNLDFGNPANHGSYRIYASKNGSGCALVLPGTNWIEPSPTQYEFMPAGEFCAGEVDNYWLSGSQTGFKYEIHNITTDVYSSPFIGTGGIINFGPLLNPGVYEVIATDINNTASTFCQQIMRENVTIHSNPQQNYMLSPQGTQCEGIEVKLPSSESGIWYHLYRMQSPTIPYSDAPISSRAGTGSALNFGVPTESGLYMILAVNRWSISDSCSVWLPGNIELCKRPLIKDISPFGHVCETSEIQVLNHQQGVTYQLIKDGNLSSPYQSINAGVPAVIFTPNLSPNFGPGTYTVRAISSCSPNTCDRMMNGSVIADSIPVVNAGENDSICVLPSATIAITGTASNYNTDPAMIEWVDLTSSGVFTNPHSLITGYTPNSIPGMRRLQLTVRGINGCNGITVSDEKDVKVFMLATVNAGIDQSICDNATATMSGVVGGGARSGIWSTRGTGLFDHPTSMNAIYSPGEEDIIAGRVTLILTTTDGAPCGDVSDSTIISINPTPVVGAKTSTICSGNTFSITPTGVPAGTTYTWSAPLISPEGSISDGSAQSVGQSTISQLLTNTSLSSATATYIVTPLTGNCPGNNFTVTVTVKPKPSVISQADTICSGTVFTVVPTGVTAGTTYTWSAPVINPVSAISGGSAVSIHQSSISQLLTNLTTEPATATYTVTPLTGNCPGADFSVVITVNPVAQVNIPPGQAKCVGELTDTIKFSTVNSGGITTYSWTNSEPGIGLSSSGNGNINSFTTINRGTIPIKAKISVKPYFTNGGISCEDTVQSFFIKVFPKFVVGSVLSDQSICYNTIPAMLTGIAPTGGDSIYSYKWQYSTDGGIIWSDILSDGDSLDYQPGLLRQSTSYRQIQTSNMCGSLVTNSVTIDVRIPVVNAGPNDTICGLVPYVFSQATDEYAVNYAWSSTGTGSFTGQYLLRATYFPSPADMNLGSVVLTLTIRDECGNVVTDNMTLTLGQLPSAFYSFKTPVCSNTPVFFTDQSSVSNGFINKWVWDYGDGTRDTLNFPNNPDVRHIFATPGSSYLVKLRVYTSLGCSSEYQQIITNLKAPVANFFHSNISCDNQPVQFTNTSQINSGLSMQPWVWDFGDPVSGSNNTSNLVNPVHQFSDSGKFTVSLIVLNSNNCLDTIRNTVNINPHPAVEFNFGTTCLNEPVYFTPDPSITNNNSSKTLSWDFGDGVNSNIRNTVHVFNAPGVYNVKLSVTDTVGCESSISHIVTINPLPIAHFNAVRANCTSSTVTFNELTSTSTGYVVKWNWDFGDGKFQTVQHPNNPNVTHVYSKPGTYNIILSIETSDNCSNSEIQTITILPNPVADFDYYTSCDDLSVSFVDLTQNNGGGNLLNWSWNFGDPNSGVNNVSILENPTHLFSDTGSYNVTLTVSNSNGCENKMTQTIVVTAKLLSGFTLSATRCEGDIVAFSDASTTPPGTAITSYIWNFGDDGASTLPSPTHIYTAFGTYSVSLKIVNSKGCVSTSTQQVTVNHKPVADFSVSEIRCIANPVSFTDHSFVTTGYNNFITTWVWDFGDGSTPLTINYPSIPDIKYIFNPGASTYKVRLTVTTNSGCSGYKEIDLAVNTAKFNGTFGPYCDSDSPVTLSATPSGGTFSGLGVQGNKFNPAAAGVGLHTITYSSPSGSCPVDPIIINVVSVPILKTSPQMVISCNDTTDLTLPIVTAGSTPGLYFTYFTDIEATNPIVNPKAVVPGTYYIRGATMSGKCFDIKPVTVTQSDTLKAKLNAVSPSCSGSANGSITVMVTKGTAPYTYQWNTSPAQTTQTINNLKSGVYNVVVTDANLCSVTLTDTLIDHPNVKIYIVHKDLLCPNDANGSARVDSITFSGKASPLNLYTYKWNTTPVQTTREATRLDNRYYTVMLTDAKGCGIKDSVYIDVLDTIHPTINCLQDTVSIVLQATSYDPVDNAQNTFVVELSRPAVSDNCGVASLTNDAPEKFRLGITKVIWTVTDFVGLSDTCMQIIYLKSIPVIPKLISPNGDGINDYFVIDGLKDFPKSQLSIFTRSGQLVFSSEDYKNEWDGRFMTSTWSNNQIVAPGVYYYILNLGGTTQKIKGFVYIYY